MPKYQRAMGGMRYLFYTLFLLEAAWFAGNAQTTGHALGLELNDEEYRQLARTTENIRVDLGRKSLITKVDLTPYCPEIQDQGDIASCVGWSLGYGAMTIEKAVRNGWTDRRKITENAHSALFIYNLLNNGDCRRGIRMPAALELVKETGNCLASDFELTGDVCQEEVADTLLEKAEGYRIEEYVPLFQPEAEAQEKIKKLKLVLAQRKPVVVGVELRRNFRQIAEGDRSWWPNLPDTTYIGSHAMVVVGYDDEKFKNPRRSLDPGMEGAFQLMNSWGKNWGEEGFIWVRYAHFADYCRHAYAIRLADSEAIRLEPEAVETPVAPPPPDTPPAPARTNAPDPSPRANENAGKTTIEAPPRELSGAFGFRSLAGWDQSVRPAVPVFEEASVRLIAPGHYQLAGDWNTGARFQLQVNSDFDNGYIYVFSVDPTGKTEVHFPKSEEYNVAFKGLSGSALLLFGGSQLTIPAPNRALLLSQVGKDHLIVLFSTHKIPPEYLNRLCDALAAGRDQPKETLHAALGKSMVPLPDIAYAPAAMGFEVHTRSEGKIVPVLLTVEVSRGVD